MENQESSPESSSESPEASQLQKLRERIDDVDRQIQDLINLRASIAQEVALSKSGSQAVEFYRPEREAQVLRTVVARNQGPLSDEEIARLFREIMSACLAQEAPLKVAFLGPEGTFSQQAVLKHFGHSVRALAMATIDEVFREVEAGVADFGVVPIENSTEGVVNNTLDMFLTSPLRVCGEVELRVRQHLMGRMKDVRQVQRICSHQQSLAQCRGWLMEFLPDVPQISVASNAEAARRARDEQGTAAIAGEVAAEVYGLDILVADIEDHADNTTRFLVVGKKASPPSGKDKTSLLLSTSGTDNSGVLFELLRPLAEHKVNMTRIESRPSRRRKWDYVFFVDVEGHAEDPGVLAALQEIRERATLFRVLGSYPCAVL